MHQCDTADPRRCLAKRVGENLQRCVALQKVGDAPGLMDNPRTALGDEPYGRRNPAGETAAVDGEMVLDRGFVDRAGEGHWMSVLQLYCADER